VRVFPNLYPAVLDPAPTPPQAAPFETLPASGRHEVVVHVPRHAVTFADLTARECADVAAAWRARAAEARTAGFFYVHALINEGRAAGASRPHTHSQMVWLRELPPAVSAETTGGSDCALCAMVSAERAASARVVLERRGIVALCPFASSMPFELLLAPIACQSDAFASRDLDRALDVLAESVRRLRTLVPGAPVNVWLHAAPLQGGAAHWHLHVVPRLTVTAGLELGAGLFVNAVAPERAAAELRDGSTA